MPYTPAMTDSDELKQHIDSTIDFYDLLGVTTTSNESEVRRAYRKTALKYHPDKVGANPEALEKFHLLQIAYDVLSDSSIKELYDNARRAKEEKKAREQQYDSRRKAFKDELEAREAGGLKRKAEESEFELKLARLAADGKRRREERTEMLRRAAREEVEAERRREEEVSVQPVYAAPPVPVSVAYTKDGMEDAECSVTIKFPRVEKTTEWTSKTVMELFERFGKIDDIVMRDKQLKPPGGKHRVPYCSGVLVYSSSKDAQKAVTAFPALSKSDEHFGIIESVSLVGKAGEPLQMPTAQGEKAAPKEEPATQDQMPSTGSKAPKFASFRNAKRRREEEMKKSA